MLRLLYANSSSRRHLEDEGLWKENPNRLQQLLSVIKMFVLKNLLRSEISFITIIIGILLRLLCICSGDP